MSTEMRAVITGAGSGLGRALALDVARRGGRVVVADIDEVGAAETARLVERAGGEAHAMACDVSDAAQVERLAADATERLGEIDLLVNNAGVAVGGAFEEISLDDWGWIVGINLWGVVHGCRAFLPAMKARGRGHVINIASAAGLVSMPGMSPYNATKAAVVALSETLHGECKAHGVQVSVVCPTFFATNIARSARGSRGAERLLGAIQKRMENVRVQASDVARAAIDGALAGDLYILPMRDGRMMWRLERAVPDLFYKGLGPWLSSRLGRMQSRG